jgi:hypothetical protein
MGVSVPTGVNEHEAASSAQEQFTQASFGCPDEPAPDIMRRAQ